MTVNQGGECNTLGISNRDALLMTLSRELKDDSLQTESKALDHTHRSQ